MKKKLKVSIIQSDIEWLDRNKNRNNITEKINKITETDIVFLPEMFDTGFYVEPHTLDYTEQEKTINWLKNICNQKKIHIGATTIVKNKDKFNNRFLFCYPNKKIEFYNKRHLFKHAGELKEFLSGTKQQIVEIDNWKIKLQICYDLRFPVWSRNTEDYHILVYLANWPTSRITQWKILLRARAIENQSYTIGVNRVGTDGNGFEYPGMSMIINPKGEIIYEAKKNNEDIFTTEFDFEKLKSIRKKFPVLDDRDKFKI